MTQSKILTSKNIAKICKISFKAKYQSNVIDLMILQVPQRLRAV